MIYDPRLLDLNPNLFSVCYKPDDTIIDKSVDESCVCVRPDDGCRVASKQGVRDSIFSSTSRKAAELF